MTTVDSEFAAAGESSVEPKPAPTWKSQVINWLRRVMIVAVVVGAGWYLVTQWDAVIATLSTIPWYSVVLSMVAVCAGVVFGAFSWRVIAVDLGATIGHIRGSQIYLVSQLGKYVPGSVWAYLLQMELGKKVGIPRARMFVSTLVQVGVSVVAMLTLGMIALPRLLKDNPEAAWLYALLPLSIVALHPKVMTWGVNLVLKVVRRPPLDQPLRWTTIGKTLGYSVLAQAFMGAHLWLLATASGDFDPSLLLICIGTMSIGMLAGILFFIVPSGAGARDLLVALALTPAVGATAAAAFAVASRVMFTVAELGTAGISAALVRATDRPKA
jgi:glycosyltransferase 2 family protein